MAALEFHDPGWHGVLKTPVVDGKYIDPKSGELRTITNDDTSPGYYSGPPAVDIVIQNVATDGIYRMAQPFPMEALLSVIMGVIKEKNLSLDSVMATSYTIRVILSHEMTKEQYREIARKMMHGIRDEKEQT
ncbi:unnamed protein product [Clonostachys rosea f. rosea IK726]|jgi:hypothetical protein|uniref:Uncharacterized protein n=1 Tax=Clonostachys rosea f. rosea IK726 TaxID=1349383 RepID=A0ACA9TFD6_BIOOC|nr:unnamed protein product [Clonostachys rosea f. rosea IK726]